ncbi:MAG: exonuclease domain-containing protein [Cellulosilyticum sp.]|nr:exonuclease domain-containing protein [Cellulosilyticum sp.]
MNRYVVLDIETTGTHPTRNEIIEIGAVYIENGKPIKKFNQLVCPRESISDYITSITGIDDEMVKDAPPIEVVMPEFIEFCGDATLIGHNIILFDYRMLKATAIKLGYTFERLGLDTLVISRKVLQELPSRKLGALCEHYHINLEHAHRAYDDAYATYELFVHLQDEFGEKMPELFIPEPMIWNMPKWEPITAKQQSYLKSLCAKHQLELPNNMERLSKSEASRMIDKIISQYGKIIR